MAHSPAGDILRARLSVSSGNFRTQYGETQAGKTTAMALLLVPGAAP